MKLYLLTAFAILLLAACTPQPQPAAPRESEPPATVLPLPTPFPMSGGVFIGAPQDFLLQPAELGGAYVAADAGVESPNSGVLEGRTDGAAYIAATGRLTGWRIQFNGAAEGQVPPYIVNLVNTYATAEGAQLVLSRDWHADVWKLIDGGQLTELPQIEGLDSQHLVWQTAEGAIGVEIIYRNLYIFFTGPTDGSQAAYQFFANLAVSHLDWIKAGEQ